MARAEPGVGRPLPGGEAGQGAGEPAPTGLDWPGLMRAGLRGLGLKPAEFWELTPAELALMLGIEFGAGAMTRSSLQELMARFPDRPGAGADRPRPRAGPQNARG